MLCLPYDILVFSRTFNEHKINVKVLTCLKKKGIKLNAGKCNLFKREIRYLGWLISEDVKALDKCKVPPTTIRKLRSLIGFLGYYRTYIKDFPRKLKPVYDLLQKKTDKLNEKKHLDSKMKINWTDEHQKVIDETVEYLKSPNIIAYSDFNVPFIVHCDASQDGLGDVLYQKQGGEIKIISLASRTLTPAERNYSMHSGKLEFLALKCSITEKFKDYLMNGPPFEVVTDNNPLTYVLTTAKLNSTGLRWIADLANYQFSIRCRSGKKHLGTDCLSRNVIDDFIELKGSVEKSVEVEDINAVLTSAFRKLIDYVMVESVEVKCDGKLEKIGKKIDRCAERS